MPNSNVISLGYIELVALSSGPIVAACDADMDSVNDAD